MVNKTKKSFAELRKMAKVKKQLLHQINIESWWDSYEWCLRHIELFGGKEQTRAQIKSIKAEFFTINKAENPDNFKLDDWQNLKPEFHSPK